MGILFSEIIQQVLNDLLEAKLFSEILQNVLNDLVSGRKDALSKFMANETRRVVAHSRIDRT